ncbi:MAG TPA: bifunctional demethylmenaquinone methyltransferase/2-methoxy-6-polyprenyl-1,4-benzoquinol methylase UbiE [Ignavibacteriaceae bacterium]|nr:bifunctional demethylmenaquinone methyltransferase/2-methoxy-6-polyprenyl-1,4-benzoquinol methylase UbiE [Ignavibacteriaceae bacterium]
MDKKKKVRNIFESIAFRYDILNHLLSFGVDFYWRKKAIQFSKIKKDALLLDVACGTGDFSIRARKDGINNIIGADFSFNMLKLYKEKSNLIDGRMVQMAAEHMPFKDNVIDNIIVAFGVRNFYDLQEGFNSFYRVLNNSGKATILEFRMPESKFFKSFYKFYFKRVLPVVGGVVSGNKEAYKYLPASVEEFDEKIIMPDLLRKSGFKKINVYTLTFGIVQVVVAEK